MPVDVKTDIVIARPRALVSAYAMNPEHAPAWYANIASIEWQTEPPVRVGSRMAFVARFLGRRLAYTYEVTAFEPETLLVMRTSEGPFPMETTYAFETVEDEHTRMTLRNRGEPTGFFALASGLMERAMRRANAKDLRQIKALLEAESAI